MENKENKENKTMSIHLKLTDNRTGRILHESDGMLLIGAFCINDHETHGLLTGSGHPLMYLNILHVFDNIKEKIYKQTPELQKVYELSKLLGADKDLHSVTEIDLSALLKNREKGSPEV